MNEDEDGLREDERIGDPALEGERVEVLERSSELRSRDSRKSYRCNAWKSRCCDWIREARS